MRTKPEVAVAIEAGDEESIKWQLAERFTRAQPDPRYVIVMPAAEWNPVE